MNWVHYNLSAARCPLPLARSLGIVDVCQCLNKFEACKVVDECVLAGRCWVLQASRLRGTRLG